jgi:cysteine desulfurase / selenocysteine lyase
MRDDFPFFEKNPKAVYLDSAATSQTLSCVISDTNNFYTNHKSNAHRSGHSMGTWVDEKYSQAKFLIGKWLGIDNHDKRIIFTSGASQSLNDAIQMISNTSTSVTAYIGIDFHHSLYLPMKSLGWKVETVNITDNGDLDFDDLQSKLRQDTSTCKVLAVSAVSNVIGRVNCLDSIKSVAKKHNLITIIDASQLLTKRKVSLEGFDFVAWSWHKLYGPTGLGCLVIDNRWSNCIPTRPGGGSVTSVMLDNINYQDNAARFESGTQNLAAISTIPNLVQWILDHEHILEEHDKLLASVANDLAGNSLFVTHTGLISLDLNIGAIEDYVMLLDAKNIYVRGGKLCAQPLVDSISSNKSVLRISWGAYTSVEELEVAFKSIGDISARLSRYV